MISNKLRVATDAAPARVQVPIGLPSTLATAVVGDDPQLLAEISTCLRADVRSYLKRLAVSHAGGDDFGIIVGRLFTGCCPSHLLNDSRAKLGGGSARLVQLPHHVLETVDVKYVHVPRRVTCGLNKAMFNAGHSLVDLRPVGVARALRWGRRPLNERTNPKESAHLESVLFWTSTPSSPLIVFRMPH